MGSETNLNVKCTNLIGNITRRDTNEKGWIVLGNDSDVEHGWVC